MQFTERGPKNYRCFISHAWQYNRSYDRLEEMLDDAPRFKWSNHSVPRHDSLDTASNRELKDALRNQISGTGIVIILAGMYYDHSRWILEEMQIAENMDKPILAIKPWGAQRTPAAVQDKAIELVNWNTSSIVQAIRTHYK